MAAISGVTRVFWLPRQDEGEVISAATCRGVALSPTQFATTASILRLADDQWLFSTLSRVEWDPIAWRVERMGTKAPAFHSWAREAVARLAGDLRSAVAVGDKQAAIAEALAAAACPAVGTGRSHNLWSRRGWPCRWRGGPRGPRDFCEARQADGIRASASCGPEAACQARTAVARSLQAVLPAQGCSRSSICLTDARATGRW